MELNEISNLLDLLESDELDYQQLSGKELKCVIGTNLDCKRETKIAAWAEFQTRQDKSNQRRYA